MLLKLILGISPPQRQARGVRRLLAAHLPTPEVLAMRVRPRGRKWPVLEMETRHVPGKPIWHSLNSRGKGPPISDPVRLARQLGELVAALTRVGLFHRDLKLDNIVIEDGDHVKLWLIDQDGVRVMRNRNAEIARMIERLAILPIHRGIPLSRSTLRAALRAATAPLTREGRRDVLRRLRTLGEAKATGGI